MAYVESNNDLPIDRYYLLKDLGGYYFIKYNKKNFEKLYNTSKEILSNIKKMTSDEKIKLKGYTSLAHIEYTKKPDEIFFKSYKEIGVSEEDDDADQYYFCSIWSPHIIVKNFQLSLNIKCIEYELNDKKLLIDNRSCIFIGPYKTPLIKHQNEAIDIINTFLSLANVFDVNARSVSVNEYMALKCKNVYNNLRGFGFFSNLSSRRSALIPLVSRGEPYIIYDRSTKKEVQIVNSKVFDKIYSYMNKTLSNSDMKISLWLFLEGYNSYLNADYKSSYLSCWTVLEKFIESDWNAYILTIKTNKERRRKLKNSMLWTIDYKIETLNMAKIYDDSLYSELMRYKRFRNRIIHDGVKCPKSNSEKIILKCKSFLIEKFNLK